MFDRNYHIVFATNFSDACHAAIPAVARWVDQLGCRLTILHVYEPDNTLYREAETLLQSFYAEADNYQQSERVLIAGEPAAGIAQFCRSQKNVLLLLPPSDQTGLPRPWHRSLRAELLAKLDVPIWTLGRTLVGEPMPSMNKQVAVLITAPEEGADHLCQAAAYAVETGATLHIMHIVPNIDEGSITATLTSSAPLGMESAMNWLSDVTDSLKFVPKVEVHIEQGNLRRTLPKLLHRCGANLVFVSSHAALQQSFFRPAIHSSFGKLNASILCIRSSSLTNQPSGTLIQNPASPGWERSTSGDRLLS